MPRTDPLPPPGEHDRKAEEVGGPYARYVLGVLVVVPVANIFSEAFAKGTGFYMEALRDEDTISALNLSLKIAAVVVPLNALFGLTAAWAVTKFDFPGKPLLVTFIDLPLAVSPVVARCQSVRCS